MTRDRVRRLSLGNHDVLFQPHTKTDRPIDRGRIMDIDVFIQGNADFRVTTGKSRRSIQGASRARHARLPFNRAAAIYRLRSMGCQGAGARIQHLERSLSLRKSGPRQARSFLSILPPHRVTIRRFARSRKFYWRPEKQLVLVWR